MSCVNSYRIEHTADVTECHGLFIYNRTHSGSMQMLWVNACRLEQTADLTECHGFIHVE